MRTRNGVRAVLRAQLAGDIVDMGIDRAQRNDQPAGDLFVGETLGHQPEHVQLARRERLDQGRGSTVANDGRLL